MRTKKQIIKIMISTLLLLSCMILFVGCGNSKPQSAANDSTDTSQNDNADSNANSDDNEPTQNTSKFSLKQVEFNAKGHFEFIGDSDYGRFRYNDKYGIIDIDGNVVIEPQKILYFEYEGNRKVKLVSTETVYHIIGSMSELENQLQQYHFIMPHKSFLVNVACINSFYNDIILSNGMKIPIAKNRRKQVHEKISDYLHHHLQK